MGFKKLLDKIRVYLARRKVYQFVRINRELIMKQMLKDHPEMEELVKCYTKELFNDDKKM